MGENSAIGLEEIDTLHYVITTGVYTAEELRAYLHFPGLTVNPAPEEPEEELSW